ncbi:MAG: ribonuclease HII, partial [Spirochaetaceae bacterium]|nr:ribonuclease HII [Spirochaetaceae bacterium]
MIVGIDEAGRGPLAGPVCAAAVILGPDFPVALLDDSKKLSAKKREAAMTLIYREALAWGIGWASAFEIDKINILRASLLAMRRACLDLTSRAELPGGPDSLEALVDGIHVPDIPIPARAVI